MKTKVEETKEKLTSEQKDASKKLSEHNRGVHIQGLNQGVMVVSDSPEDNLNRLCNVAIALYKDLRQIEREG